MIKQILRHFRSLPTRILLIDLLLVLVLGNYMKIGHVEVKGGKGQGNVQKQFETFLDYLERTHGPYLEQLCYVPVLAKNAKTQTHKQLCGKHMLDIESSEEEFQNWWDTSLQLENNSEASDEKFKEIVKRLIMMASLVLTSFPMELTQTCVDSHLIMLRYFVKL